MPIVEQSQVLQSRSAAMTNILNNPDHPLHNTAGEIWSGSFNEANLTFNTINFFRRERQFPADLTYEVESDEEIRPWFEMYSEEFTSSLSKAESMAIVERIEKNNEHRHVLATSGAAGFMATIAAGVADPITWLVPIGWVGKAFQSSRIATKAFMAAKYGVAASDDAVKLGVRLLPEEVDLLKVGVPKVAETVEGEVAALRGLGVKQAEAAAARAEGALEIAEKSVVPDITGEVAAIVRIGTRTAKETRDVVAKHVALTEQAGKELLSEAKAGSKATMESVESLLKGGTKETEKAGRELVSGVEDSVKATLASVNASLKEAREAAKALPAGAAKALLDEAESAARVEIKLASDALKEQAVYVKGLEKELKPRLAKLRGPTATAEELDEIRELLQHRTRNALFTPRQALGIVEVARVSLAKRVLTEADEIVKGWKAEVGKRLESGKAVVQEGLDDAQLRVWEGEDIVAGWKDELFRTVDEAKAVSTQGIEDATLKLFEAEYIVDAWKAEAAARLQAGEAVVAEGVADSRAALDQANRVLANRMERLAAAKASWDTKLAKVARAGRIEEARAAVVAAKGVVETRKLAQASAMVEGEARVAAIRTSHAAALGKIAQHKEHLVKLAKEAGEGLPTTLSAAAKGGGKAAAVGAAFGGGSEVILQALQEGRDEDLVIFSALSGAALGVVLGGLGAIPHAISQKRLNRAHRAMIEDLTAGDVFSRMPESSKFTLEEIRKISRDAEAAKPKDVPRGTSGKAIPQAAADEVRAVSEDSTSRGSVAVADAVAERVAAHSPDMGAILKDESSILRRALTRFGLSPAGRTAFALVDDAAALIHRMLPLPYLQRSGDVKPSVFARAQAHVEVGLLHVREIAKLKGKMDHQDFSRGIANILRTGETENVASEVVQAAGILKGYFAKWEEALKKENLLPEDFDLGVDAGYFPRLFDFEKLRNNRSGFIELVEPHVGGIKKATELTDELIEHGPNALNLDPFNATGATARLKGRVLKQVPSAKIADFLIDDVNLVIERYAQQVGAQLELAKLQKKGTVSQRLRLTEFLGDRNAGTKGIIEERYDALIAAAKSDKQKNRLLAEKVRTIRDLEYVRQSILGDLNRDPFDAGSRAISGAATTATSFAYLSNAGFNSLNDIVAPIFRDGARSYFRVAVGRLRRSLQSLKQEVDKDDLARAAWLYQWVGAEHSRSGMLFDFMGDTGVAPRGRGGLMRRAHNTFMVANMMRPVTAFAAEHSTYMAIDTLLRAARKLSDGVALSRTEMNRLRLSGLDEATASRIGREMKAGGAVQEGGIWLPMISKWGDQELGDTFRTAVIQSNRHAVLNPTKGEIPMAFNNPFGRVLFQFMSWPLQATQSYLIAGIQRGDAAAVQGALAMTGMGMFIVAVNAVSRGDEIPELDDLISQGIERGGVLGVLTDLNMFGSRMTGGTADLNQLFGTDSVASRYGPMEGGDVIPGLGIVDRIRKDIGVLARLRNGDEISEQQAKAFARRRFMMGAVYTAPIRNAIQEAVQSDGN